MQIDKEKTNVIVLSRNQWGKTTLVKNLIAEMPEKSCVIFDTHDEYFGNNDIISPNKIYNSSMLSKFIKTITTENKYRRKFVIIDDIDVYKPEKSTEFYNFCISNAHYKNGLLLIARRAIWLPKIIIGNAHYIIFSGAIPPEDIFYLQKIGINKSVLEKSKLLEPHNFLCYDAITNKMEKMVSHV